MLKNVQCGTFQTATKHPFKSCFVTYGLVIIYQFYFFRGLSGVGMLKYFWASVKEDINNATPASSCLRRAATRPRASPQIQLLADLLEKMMMLEPEKRLDTDTAMRHPFVRSFLPKKHEHATTGAGPT